MDDIQNGLFGIHGLHGPEDESVNWKDFGGDQRRKDQLTNKHKKEKENLMQDSVFDMTAFGKPMPTFLRHRFRFVWGIKALQ